MGRGARRRRALGLGALACAFALLTVGCTSAPPRSGPDTATTTASSPVTSTQASSAASLPAVTDPATTFSFAVVPDTQPEVRADDPRTDKRIAWLVAHRQQ